MCVVCVCVACLCVCVYVFVCEYIGMCACFGVVYNRLIQIDFPPTHNNISDSCNGNRKEQPLEYLPLSLGHIIVFTQA